MNFSSSLFIFSFVLQFGNYISLDFASNGDKNETNFHGGDLKSQIHEELQKILQKEYKIFEKFQYRYNKTYLNEEEVI